ncbi:TPA: DedA family protein [Vibrio parahaemolyticus]|uniref:DedA family protein n=1 Tax=Vibrio parahaemolyticus TaxID=670 RepID=UPI00040937A7|nr:DedA family protein [Vibrio parahaemolyticus]EGQ8100724.1 DedA family protein [Vibrio parahaemolyticus]EGQ9286010.1 DedA family protein [Vibrio parahaemolyticus]EGR0932865.1 DedA family protein [Vibrio parahaemolyticus]EHW0692121.1 DedA family protein [Vibrio parahaemolyticus]EID4381665.1 DedA family protein [Vibrio parahaemolyticus]
MFDSMMGVLLAFWHQDFSALMAPGSAGIIYIVVATLIFLESGFIPAAPFPCDSVVVLSGTLAAVGVLDPIAIMLVIIVSAGLGSWAAYLQGKWLNLLPKVQGWVNAVPQKRLEQVDVLLGKHGLIALFCARFIPVVRSLLPLMMGLRVKRVSKFHYFAWLSAILWTLLLCGFGMLLPLLPENISKMVTMGLMAAPVITLTIAVMSFVILKVRKARFKSKAASQLS